MSKRDQRATPGDEQRQAGASGPSDQARARAGKPEAPRGKGRKRSWLRANRADLRFLGIFGVCLGVFYLATLAPPVKNGLFPNYLRFNADASGLALRLLGQGVTVADKSLVSDRGPSIRIERGCDAVAPSALFVSAVLASPVALASRLSAAVVGTLLLMLLNLLRVISLFLVRLHFPRAFDVMHLDVWQALFIFLAILFWALWASWATRRQGARSHAAA